MSEDAEAEASRSLRRCDAAAADHDRRSTRPEGTGAYVGTAPFVLDDVVPEQPDQQIELLVGERTPVPGVETEVLVLLVSVTDAEHEGRPPMAHDVEHGDLLGQSHRIAERQHHRGDDDPDFGRPGRDPCGEQERRGEMSVVGAVVLRDDDG